MKLSASPRIAPPKELLARRHRWVILDIESRPSAGSGRREFSRTHVERLLAAVQSLPRDHIFAVVLESESPWWAPLLTGLPETNIVEQPIERGSATGVLLAFLRIFRRDPSAEILIATVGADPAALEECVESRTAFASARHDDRALISTDASGSVTLCVAPSAAVLRLFRESQPDLFRMALDFVRKEPLDAPASLDALYPFLPEVDLERDVIRFCGDARSLYDQTSLHGLPPAVAISSRFAVRA